MKRFLIAATVSLALVACASGPRGPRFGKIEPVANPSAVIAAELAFARLAQEKGQWAAFRATAADGAEMFVPHRVKAADWLKGRAEPTVAVKWQPHAVWSSCDGTYAVTRGGWASPNASGTFATIWQRQKNGALKWIADMSLTTESVSATNDMIAASVADCDNKLRSSVAVTGTSRDGVADDAKSGTSTDGTLSWNTLVWPDGSRLLEVHMWKAGEMRLVLSAQVPASGAAR